MTYKPFKQSRQQVPNVIKAVAEPKDLDGDEPEPEPETVKVAYVNGEWYEGG